MFHDREKIQGAWYSRPSTQRNARFLTVDATATYITGKNETSYYPRAQIFRIENHRFCYFIGIDQLRSSLILLVNSFFFVWIYHFFKIYILVFKFSFEISFLKERKEGGRNKRERERETRPLANSRVPFHPRRKKEILSQPFNQPLETALPLNLNFHF